MLITSGPTAYISLTLNPWVPNPIWLTPSLTADLWHIIAMAIVSRDCHRITLSYWIKMAHLNIMIKDKLPIILILYIHFYPISFCSCIFCAVLSYFRCSTQFLVFFSCTMYLLHSLCVKSQDTSVFMIRGVARYPGSIMWWIQPLSFSININKFLPKFLVFL